MPTPPDTTPKTPASQRVTLTRWEKDEVIARVVTNRDVANLIEDEAISALGRMQAHFGGDLDDYEPPRIWAVITSGGNVGALVAVVSLVQSFSDPARAPIVDVMALAANGPQVLTLRMQDLRTATSADFDAPAVLAEVLGW